MIRVPFAAFTKCLDWPKLILLTATTVQLFLASSELLDHLKSFHFSSVLTLGFTLQLNFSMQH